METDVPFQEDSQTLSIMKTETLKHCLQTFFPLVSFAWDFSVFWKQIHKKNVDFNPLQKRIIRCANRDIQVQMCHTSFKRGFVSLHYNSCNPLFVPCIFLYLFICWQSQLPIGNNQNEISFNPFSLFVYLSSFLQGLKIKIFLFESWSNTKPRLFLCVLTFPTFALGLQRLNSESCW